MLLADLIEYSSFRSGRTDAIHRNVEVCSFFRDRFSQSNDPSFCSTVSCSVGIAFFPCYGSDINHASIVLLAHHWDDRATTVVHRIEVDIDDILPVWHRIFPRWDGWARDPRIVDQNINTTQIGRRLLSSGRNSARIGHIDNA